MATSVFDNFEVGHLMPWDLNADPIPEGWISVGQAHYEGQNKNYIVIMKLSNLDWVEHLAKTKGLVV